MQDPGVDYDFDADDPDEHPFGLGIAIGPSLEGERGQARVHPSLAEIEGLSLNRCLRNEDDKTVLCLGNPCFSGGDMVHLMQFYINLIDLCPNLDRFKLPRINICDSTVAEHRDLVEKLLKFCQRLKHIPIDIQFGTLDGPLVQRLPSFQPMGQEIISINLSEDLSCEKNLNQILSLLSQMFPDIKSHRLEVQFKRKMGAESSSIKFCVPGSFLHSVKGFKISEGPAGDFQMIVDKEFSVNATSAKPRRTGVRV